MNRCCALLSVLLALGTAPARADPGNYLLTPYSMNGATALDLRYWSVDSPEYGNTVWPEIGLRHGFTPRWTSEVFASFIGAQLSHQYLSSWNWQNTVLLTEGKQDFDLGLHLQWIKPEGRRALIEAGLLGQTDFGATRVNLNVVFERQNRSGAKTKLKTQWQALHRLSPGLRLGVQGFSEFGPVNHWAEHPSHRVGPVLRIGLFEHRVEFQAAYLWGKTYGERGDMFSAQLLFWF